MFEEGSFKIYIRNELIEVDISEQTKTKRATENRRLVINELMERTCDTYWKVEERGNDEQTNELIKELKSRLEPLIQNV